MHKIGHKIYDYQVNGFFLPGIYRLWNNTQSTKFLFTLSNLGKETAGIDDEWEEITRPYVVKYKAKIADFEYFTFYDSEEEISSRLS